MVKKSYVDNETIYELTALVNNFRSDFNNNIAEKDKVAEKLEMICMSLDAGIRPGTLDITSVLNSALEVTKSDPLAGKEFCDELNDASDEIINQLMLPTLDINFLKTNLRIFQKTFSRSGRRHTKERDKVQLETMQTLNKHIQYITITSREGEKSKKGRKLFPKKDPGE